MAYSDRYRKEEVPVLGTSYFFALMATGTLNPARIGRRSIKEPILQTNGSREIRYVIDESEYRPAPEEFVHSYA